MVASIVDSLDGAINHLAYLADDPRIDYQSVVVWSSFLTTAFEVWLNRRQLRQYDKPKPPPELASHISDDKFRKAQAYGRDKTRYSLFKAVFNQILGWAIIRSRLYAKLWYVTGGWMDTLGLAPSRTIVHSMMWISTLVVFSTIPSIPWNYYYTFVLEEKHGFNKSTLKLWIMDQIKSTVLLAAIGLPILAAFLKIIELAGRRFVPWLMLFLITVQLSMQMIYPTFIQPLFNKLTPLPEGELRTRVENLAAKLKFPLNHLYVIDGSKRSGHSNAYFYGLPWSKHIVIYDTLMEQSSPAEVEAVLGHELGHWSYTHPTKLLLIIQLHLLTTLTTFSIFIHNRALFDSFGFDPQLAITGVAGGPQPIIIGFMLFQLVLEPQDTVVNFLIHALTRKYEYQADEFAVKLDKKEDLASALIKLHIDNLSAPHNDKLYSMYHHSHPTLPERLRAMETYVRAVDVQGKKDL
ncbi:metalloendopeptidase [Kockovaella imperatae]|uniref:CAAX prenyl protease n=1 Tax=Kockovaella imperatae TaxID=4999 RepID=A0A1Y1U5G5_9TREE|nr:metalloendopeptidase [Kockovaella imperatae]ORX33273.1 metalloendopeptidase [Kockovaella imperatae]